MGSHFDAGSLERSYSFLDDCPESLLQEVITLPDATLRERVAGVVRWRAALLAGQLPPEDGWPPPALAAPARRALASLGIARFCRDQVELVDTLLRDVLRSFSSVARSFSADVEARLRELEDLERARAPQAEPRDREARIEHLDVEGARRLRELAMRDVAARERPPDPELLAAWTERVRIWSEIAGVFGDLGELMGRGWDLSQGVLRHVGWTSLLELRALIERLPALQQLVRQLGRLQHRDGAESITEQIMGPVRRLHEEIRERPTPLAPSETRGIERSGEIARMLPIEASMLGHPLLRLLWHARQADRALLTYRVRGVLAERVTTERESQEERPSERPPQERGPMVIIVDTSGSMHGLPEQVAKALVLEAMRTAHAERRRCYLYAYSGPGQIVEHELDLTPAGVGRLLSFLGFTFGGGNDETGVLDRVLARLRAEAWRRADVLFISDGEWPVSGALEAKVQGAREAGTRFHGVQIGNVGRTGLHQLCDPVHVFTDWVGAGGWR